MSEIRVVGVQKRFGRARTEVEALRGVDLEVEAGEWVAIMGASGSGKSTLLHLLAALDHADAGELEVAGRDLRRLRDPNGYRRDTIGLVFQLHDLLPHLTAEQNVEIPMFGTERSRRDRRAAARHLLDAVGLAGKEHRRPPELSGGERQRVALARALANDPRILLADEPTGSLDPDAVDNVLALFRRMRAEHGVTIVMVTHAPEVAAAADRSYTMTAGTLVARSR
jgi:ABC-type lipoprotein export system ATPase subunit